MVSINTRQEFCVRCRTNRSYIEYRSKDGAKEWLCGACANALIEAGIKALLEHNQEPAGEDPNVK